MALIKCPECGKEISDKVGSCIHCGCPLSDTMWQEGVMEEYVNDTTKVNVKFYQKSGFIIWMLFLFFPLGAFLMWRYKKFNKILRVLVSVFCGIGFAFWMLVFLLASVPCSHEWEDATCIDAKRCSLCGETEGEPLGHSLMEVQIDQESTCAEEGSSSRKCSLCGEVVTEKLEKKEHIAGDWEVTLAPSNSDNGERSKKCTVCGEVLETEKIELSAAERMTWLKEQCGVYTYDEIARNPENYKGTLARFTGEVIQVIEDGEDYTLRVNVTRGEYYWDDTILVSYTKQDSNEARILEDDIITMYGTLKGTHTYETVLGSSLTVPLFYAQYIEFN